MRERLIEFCKKSQSEWLEKTYDNETDKKLEEYVADYLLANGVIVPPCKIGTHLWKVTYPYRQEPKVTEFVVRNFRTVRKGRRFQIEVQAMNVPAKSWMNPDLFFATREEADQALKGGTE